MGAIRTGRLLAVLLGLLLGIALVSPHAAAAPMVTSQAGSTMPCGDGGCGDRPMLASPICIVACGPVALAPAATIMLTSKPVRFRPSTMAAPASWISSTASPPPKLLPCC